MLHAKQMTILRMQKQVSPSPAAHPYLTLEQKRRQLRVLKQQHLQAAVDVR